MNAATLPVWHALLSSWDAWLLTCVFVAVVPIVGYVRLRRLRTKPNGVLAGRAKLVLYAKIIGWQWLLVGAMLFVLRRHGLSPRDVGEQLGDARVTLGVTAGLLIVIAVVFAIVRSRLARPRAPAAAPRNVDHLRALMPAFGWELAVFALVSVTAGVCEELLYRGWLVTILRAWTGSVWVAVGAGAAIFGVGHAYQGVKGMLRTAFVGLQLAVLFVYVNSLIPGQALHAAFDLVAGLLMATAASSRPSPRGA